MAWRSSGTTNDEMVDNLKRFRVITSAPVEAGFRNVDRKYFVPKSQFDLAHKDQPVKDGNVHLSAPHMYGSVLEALELQKDSAIVFLNAGSGSGYLTCIAASILGPRSIHFGVEVHSDVIHHSKAAIAAWKRAHPEGQKIQHIHMIHGNALELQTDKGECALGFDRIYVGAAIEADHLTMFKKMLKPGGILVGPVDDELVKVVRSQRPVANEADEFSSQVISAVRFAPLVASPSLKTVIPARIWSPEEHMFYPDSFRAACKQVLLCSNAKKDQPTEPQPVPINVNAASLLPRALWMEVLSYTHRDWFETPQSEVEFLRRRLAEEKANTERANLARIEAERRLRATEKERDVYRVLARRWKTRLQASSGVGADDTETIEEAASAMLLASREPVSLLGLGNMFRRFRARASSVGRREESENDSQDDDDEDETFGDVDRMEEEQNSEDDMSEDTDSEEDELAEEGSDSFSMASSHQGSTVDATEPHGKARRSESRTVATVSLSSEDDF
ncbi:protein-L-isoaspartateD-aspartate O-methyltransferase PCMT [Nitzschia inconspicua]|uniref:Protein-L-isoaspartateD-aspartate O-methyltransferase PCMT n=1 Tax=Nitzschia inconspicua TaxID=303405 RepID=A0A9K3L106_9STRA|nr:protein-L-isoaspartateD-aspartate O-methyltransferase PCMT [Nitzschia inconspicua]